MRWITEWPGASRAAAVSSAVTEGDVLHQSPKAGISDKMGWGSSLGADVRREINPFGGRFAIDAVLVDA